MNGNVTPDRNGRLTDRRGFLRLGGGVLAGGVSIGASSCGFGNQDDNSGGGGKKKNSKLNLYITGDVATIDLAQTQSTVDANLQLNILEGLYRLDPHNKAIPGQAKSVDVTKGKTRYTFHLRNDIKWSNGDPVTAHDFKYSWLRTLDPKTASPLGLEHLQYVEGRRPTTRGRRKLTTSASKPQTRGHSSSTCTRQRHSSWSLSPVRKAVFHSTKSSSKRRAKILPRGRTVSCITARTNYRNISHLTSSNSAKTRNTGMQRTRRSAPSKLRSSNSPPLRSTCTNQVNWISCNWTLRLRRSTRIRKSIVPIHPSRCIICT